MDIKSVNSGNLYIYDKTKEVKENKLPENKIKDRLEISNEAKIMSEKNINSKKIEEVKSKLANNFYDSDKVMDKVAEAILKEIKKTNI